MQSNHVRKNFLAIVWFFCQVSGHAANMISSHDLSWSMSLFFGMEICINTSGFWMFSGKKDSIRGSYYKAQMGFWYSAVAELKSLGLSCVIVGQQYSLDFILVSYFLFEMFGIMAEIFLLASFFLLAFDIYVFSLCIFLSAHISSL